MDHCWSQAESFFELLEGFHCDWIPGQRLRPVFQKGGEWSTDQAEVGQKVPIEV